MASGKLLLQIPTALICDPRIPPLAKALYMTLVQLGPCSLSELSAASGVNRERVRPLVAVLVKAGWVIVTGPSNRKIVLATRPESVQEALANRLRVVRPVLCPVGESLWRLLLNVAVDDDNYIDNARPHWLQMEDTKEYLELDRWYDKRRVGGEFEGAQHFVVTSLADEMKLRETKARDAAKIEICRNKSIPLMLFTEDDLSLDGVLAKIPPELPKARVNRDDIYVKTLEELCEEYVANGRKARARDQRKSERK